VSKVEIDKITKIYQGNVLAVKDASFTCEDREFIAILGPSGSGKSTTLRMIAGLEDITGGEIRFDGKVVNALGPAERNIALAFESYALYQRMTVYENIAFNLRARGMKGSEVDKKVKWIAEALEMTEILHKRPGSLSGGHQQKTNIARALVREPKVTLFDEPISHMDQRVRAAMRARIRRLHEDLKNTTMYVTHDQGEATSLCDRLVIMNFAEIQQVAPVDEIWNRPANRFVATFVGEPQMNFLEGKVESLQSAMVVTKEGKASIPFTGKIDPKYVGQPISIGLRPHQLVLATGKGVRSPIPGVVDLIEFQGENAVLTIKLSDTNSSEIKVLVRATRGTKMGEVVWFEVNPDRVHLFDKEKPIIQRGK
jgi:multiple sugar transport system ATP-binding protein